MGVIDLKAALARGEPLVQVAIHFRVDVDAVAATVRINCEHEDFDLYPQPHYDPQMRAGLATPSALERLFGLQVVRVHLERYDETTDTWSHWPDAWRWEQVGVPDLTRSEVGELLESIGLSAPGPCDDGQPWP